MPRSVPIRGVTAVAPRLTYPAAAVLAGLTCLPLLALVLIL